MNSTELPQRTAPATTPAPPPVRFQADRLPRGETAPDMADLASRVRALLDLTGGKDVKVPLGGRTFDVVLTAAGASGYAALARMDTAQPGGCGPVIAHPERPWLYWLVPPGTSARWNSPYGACLGAPGVLAVPSLQRTTAPGAHWLRPCQATHLVGPRMLHEALQQCRPHPLPAGALILRRGTRD